MPAALPPTASPTAVARNLTPAEAAEMDARTKMRTAKATWDAKEKAVEVAKRDALAARRAYEQARNDLIRQFGLD